MKTHKLSWKERIKRTGKVKTEYAHYRDLASAERAKEELLSDCYDIRIEESEL